MPAACTKLLQIGKIQQADAGMAEIDLTGIALRVGNELPQILGREILAQRHNAERLRHHANGREESGVNGSFG